MTQQEFLKKYGIGVDTFKRTGLDWNELQTIRKNFEKNREALYVDAGYVAERLRSIEQVHSVKTRTKDPEHLIEKIIRTKIENPDLSITADNYDRLITDLVGVRGVHLFKEDWEVIHAFITNTWELKKAPAAHVSETDSDGLIQRYRSEGCDIFFHPHGYRSIHYVILFERSKAEKIPVEIQVRTILEEAWSEIDHMIRYPYVNGNRIWTPYLSILNQLIAQADEINSFVRLLKKSDAAYQGEEKKGGLDPLHTEDKHQQLIDNKLKDFETNFTALRRLLRDSCQSPSSDLHTVNLIFSKNELEGGSGAVRPTQYSGLRT